MINCTDKGEHYFLKIIHNLNIKFSKSLEDLINSVFEDYGVRTEKEISEKVLFIKIYKNQS